MTSTNLFKTTRNLPVEEFFLKIQTGNEIIQGISVSADSTDLDYTFISSLVANAFFSTFPRRTNKTHPTLQNFNFADFFKGLNSNYQKSKLRSILYYFEWLENNVENSEGNLTISRQVSVRWNRWVLFHFPFVISIDNEQ